ncbi:SdiA-regulated domain-containing protein [Gimesia fumaroli]|uniref:SdiA-regulated n=1 Tax=Gimesia fumaroli TaxID=2527976 RepID=A0A518IJT1_9PLAN|nr:SdiA-regulated domain-containing protein [Gimesia fumaroli]QDV53320.1 SdiA-regulated [Gimesia fumaroli]
MTNTLALEFESAFSIRQEAEGLSEPSGLALAPDGRLWTVCDESRKLFCIDRRGQVVSTLDIDNAGLEGITFDAEGRVWVVDEDATRIIVYAPQTGEKIAARKLKKLAGYCAVAADFKGHKNKGLEGMTFDPLRSEILLLKQASPGLLIAITSQMDRITAIDRLDERSGFTAENVKSKKLHFSGMCYDAARDLFWIVSDKAERIFTFDRRRGTVVQSLALKNTQTGDTIHDAEGIAVDVEAQRLFVVSDTRAELYVFRVVSM